MSTRSLHEEQRAPYSHWESPQLWSGAKAHTNLLTCCNLCDLLHSYNLQMLSPVKCTDVFTQPRAKYASYNDQQFIKSSTHQLGWSQFSLNFLFHNISRQLCHWLVQCSSLRWSSFLCKDITRQNLVNMVEIFW